MHLYCMVLGQMNMQTKANILKMQALDPITSLLTSVNLSKIYLVEKKVAL